MIMEDVEFQEVDYILDQVNFDELGEIDWDNLFNDPQSASSPENLSSSSSSPDTLSLWIGEMENMLMNDDEHLVASPPQFSDQFFAEILADSPTNAPPDSGNGFLPQKEADDNNKVDNDSEDPEDPASKKRKRQLRNRDAAVRSRERKKMYVRDLEIKSRYLEGECRRLGRMLQCIIAENQALRLGFQNGNAYGVTSTKQESAVLLLESLLLGSLLWFLGIMCLFQLPIINLMVMVAPLKSVEKRRAERGAGSKVMRFCMMQSFVNSRRCKALRTRMKDSGGWCGETFILK